MPGISDAMLRRAAMDLLARRDYSRNELFCKLGALSQDTQLIATVLDRLEADRLLSHDRFLQGSIHRQIQKGYGPVRIAQSFRQKGIDSEEISRALEAIDADWYEVAEMVRIKKFGQRSPSNRKERAKQGRFLVYRGFPEEVIMTLLKKSDA